MNFCICNEVMFCNNTTYFIATKSEETLEYLYKYLNSPIADWYYRTKSVQLGEKAVRMFSIYMLEIPIPPMIKDIETYKLLGLTPTEVAFIENIDFSIFNKAIIKTHHVMAIKPITLRSLSVKLYKSNKSMSISKACSFVNLTEFYLPYT